jgi:hypothetical protein
MTSDLQGSTSPSILKLTASLKSIPYNTEIAYIQLFVTNNTDSTIVCSQLVFDLKIGRAANCIAEDASGIRINPVPDSDWVIVSDNNGRFTACPATASFRKLKPGSAIAFIITGIMTNELPGLTTIKVTGTGGGDEGGFTTSAEVPIAKIPAGLNITGFAVSAATVAANAPVELEWTIVGATTCTLVLPNTMLPNLSSNARFIVRPMKTTKYVLSATESGRAISEEITVVVE